MRIVGDVLSDKERERVKNPFAKNTGQKWTLTDIKKYVDLGVKKVSENQEISKIIEDSIKSFKS